MLHIELHIN